MWPFAAIVVGCATLLAIVVLWLRFQHANLLADTQAKEIQAWCMEKLEYQREQVERLAADLEDTKAKLTQLGNRTR